MIGSGYWATGITVAYHGEGRWSASVGYYDDGFCDDDPSSGVVSTQGTLGTRYQVKPDGDADVLAVVIDAVKADAESIGIRFRDDAGFPPSLYYRGDGEDPDYPPPAGWRELISKHAVRLGWDSTIYSSQDRGHGGTDE